MMYGLENLKGFLVHVLALMLQYIFVADLVELILHGFPFHSKGENLVKFKFPSTISLLNESRSGRKVRRAKEMIVSIWAFQGVEFLVNC